MKKLQGVSALLIFICIAAVAQGATLNPQSVSALLDRIGGSGASSRFITVLDSTLTDSLGRETFVISASGGKPCVKASTLSALTAGIGWYLNHHAGINISWSSPGAPLSTMPLPLPPAEEKHHSSASCRYYLNYCTFSYSMSTWTRERWMQEIDWMALHGINMPLQIVGLEEVWRRFLCDDYGYTRAEADAYIAGPCFMAWFGMNNLEGWGGPNPQWWYERQARLGADICSRMRELGIEPVLPGFCQLPSDFHEKTGVASADQGTWCHFRRPSLADPSDPGFDMAAERFYKRVGEVLGKSRYYSLDPFHEGGDVKLDPDSVYSGYYRALQRSVPGAKWVIQSWQWNKAQKRCLDNVPEGELVVLDLFSDGKPSWDSYGKHSVVYSTIFNFGGRTGLFGRLGAVVDGYFAARNSSSANVAGIGAAPEAIEQTPVAYDLLYELPWLESAPDTREWIAAYASRRYGAESAPAAEAWELLRTSALDCRNAGQGPHEAVYCSRPALEVKKVSSWGFTDIFYNTDKVVKAAYRLIDADLSGDNYSCDLADVSRQALTDYAKALLAGIREAHESADSTMFSARRDAFLNLILDIDRLLSTNSAFMLGRWTQGARDIASEHPQTSLADRDWLELENARTLITTWGPSQPALSLRDYSYRALAGMLRDYYYPRWKLWFDNGMREPDEGWFGMEWEWAHTGPGKYGTVPGGDTRAEAARILPERLSPFATADTVIYVPRLLSTDCSATLCDSASADADYVPSFTAPGTYIAEIALDLDGDGSFSKAEKAPCASFSIPAATLAGRRRCRISLADGTVLSLTLCIKNKKLE